LNLLDENFPDDQRVLLRNWRIPCRQIGRDFSRFGVKDRDIIPLLHQKRRLTFFTLDKDFFQLRLCHAAYGIAYLDTRADDAAYFVRRFLRHTRFDSEAKRMGIIARLHQNGIQFWQHKHGGTQRVGWQVDY